MPQDAKHTNYILESRLGDVYDFIPFLILYVVLERHKIINVP